jgi:hypothetical protein
MTPMMIIFTLKISLLLLSGKTLALYSSPLGTSDLSSDSNNFMIIGISLLCSFVIGFGLSIIMLKFGNFQSTLEIIDERKMKENTNDTSIELIITT